jgi:hypothetical protein
LYEQSTFLTLVSLGLMGASIPVLGFTRGAGAPVSRWMIVAALELEFAALAGYGAATYMLLQSAEYCRGRPQ